MKTQVMSRWFLVVVLCCMMFVVVVSGVKEEPRDPKKPSLVNLHKMGEPPKVRSATPLEETRARGKENMVKLVTADGEEVELTAEEMEQRKKRTTKEQTRKGKEQAKKPTQGEEIEDQTETSTGKGRYLLASLCF